MTHETAPLVPEPDGVRWLKMLDREALIGSHFTLKDGTVLKAEDFAAACPDYAIDLLYVMEQLGPDHEEFKENYAGAQHAVDVYLGATHKI